MSGHELRCVALAVLAAAGLVACGAASGTADGGNHEASCDSICRFHAECEKTCFPDEEPECDEQENYDSIYGQCK
ncbi:MAG: hypothetical protein FJ109_18140, partial [Deltaproteobacteria bacterium]|nr:hypothetical protein [Deltaproteobacteria bacterium]